MIARKIVLGLALALAIGTTSCSSSSESSGSTDTSTSRPTASKASTPDKTSKPADESKSTTTAAAGAASPTEKTGWRGPVSFTIVSANPKAAGAELDYATGDVVDGMLLLQGVCDGSGPCTLVNSPVVLAPPPPPFPALTPTGSGYSLAWTQKPCDPGGPTAAGFTIAIDGGKVSGTYDNEGGGCLVDTKATFTGNIEQAPNGSTQGG